MKKFTSLVASLAIMMVGSIAAYADNYRSVKINLRDNTSVDVALSDDMSVTFSKYYMNVRSSSLDKTLSIAREDLLSFEHSTATTALESVAADAPEYIDGARMFHNLPEGSSIIVSDASGRIVASHTAAGEFTLPVADFAHGIYIVAVNNFTLKFAVK